MRPTTILAMATTIVLAAATPALATRYASPTGTSGAPCTLDAPCTLAKAINGATDGDHVIRLFGGSYPDPAAQVATPVAGTDIAPQPGTGAP
jgi:TRAP-type mannitol/chloroaromatic compound transport system substrate-binding protein